MNTQTKREREKQLVSQMIALYCRKKHGGKGLCPDCAALNTYARQRSDRCPFMETKTFCSNCKVHCYKPEMRSQIRAVMRFSGPRMVFHHPVIAVRHVIETSKEKRRLEKTTWRSKRLCTQTSHPWKFQLFSRKSEIKKPQKNSVLIGAWGSRLSKRSSKIGTGLYCLLLLWEIISLEWIITSCSAIETRQNCV